MQIEENQITPQVFDAFVQESRLLAKRNDSLISINISRNTLIAIIFSLLIHALIFFVMPKVEFDQASAPPPQTIDVSLAPPKSEKIPEIKPPPPEKSKTKPSKTPQKVMTQKSNAKPVFSVPDTPVVPKSSAEVLPPKDNSPTDMMSYIKARQAQRQASESDAAKQNAEAVAKERGPSAEQVRDERIKRNLQAGMGGIFDITSRTSRHATLAFRGWAGDYSISKQQYFEVEASSGQDIRLQIVKRAIALIREHYQGDFPWDSQRMGRVITLSARPEDNAGLEDVLMMEFFGANYKNTQ